MGDYGLFWIYNKEDLGWFFGQAELFYSGRGQSEDSLA
jgi:hypothetical protein